MIMIAETISLGILSLPSVLDTVGLVPYAPVSSPLVDTRPWLLTHVQGVHIDHWPGNHRDIHRLRARPV